jgi:hypothetical protein
VLRSAPLGGIPGEQVLTCHGGIVAISVVDWQASGSPNLLLVFNFTSPNVEPFHNSTVLTVHGMHLSNVFKK